MHYRNGREAKNGDVIVALVSAYSAGGQNVILRTGVLHNATPGNDYCNGIMVPLDGGEVIGACLADAFHIDDVLELIGGKDRPATKP